MFAWLRRLLWGEPTIVRPVPPPPPTRTYASPVVPPTRQRNVSGTVSEIRIALPEDRNYRGELIAYDAVGNIVAGPFDVLGRANPRIQNRRNAGFGRIYPFGDTPLGVYELSKRVRNASGRLGGYALVLRPISGECARAEANGRSTIMIHGGDLSRSTDGSVQMLVSDLEFLISKLPEIAQGVRVIIDQALVYDDSGEYFVIDDNFDDVMQAYSDLFTQLGIQWLYEQDLAAQAALQDLGYETQPDEPPYQDPVPAAPEPVQSFTGYVPPADVVPEPVARPAPEPASCAPSFTGYCPPPATDPWSPSGAYER